MSGASLGVAAIVGVIVNDREIGSIVIILVCMIVHPARLSLSPRARSLRGTLGA